MCSECYACVKLCPQDAIYVRGYADFVPLGASVQPKRVDQGLRWTVKFRDGRELHFTYPSRSTPVGSSEPYRHFTRRSGQDLRSQALAGESRWLGVDRLPTLADPPLTVGAVEASQGQEQRRTSGDMAAPGTQTVECDILIIGGGMSGCGAAFEPKYLGQRLAGGGGGKSRH